jgi:hypothetical protein
VTDYSISSDNECVTFRSLPHGAYTFNSDRMLNCLARRKDRLQMKMSNPVQFMHPIYHLSAHIYAASMASVQVLDTHFEPLVEEEGVSVSISGASSGCEAHPCSLGQKCVYANFSLRCQRCDARTVGLEYLPGTNRSIACTSCPPGYGPSADSTRCNQCTAGQYSEFGICGPCPEERTTVLPGQKACIPCPAAEFQGANNFVTRPQCPGTTSSVGQPCRAGYAGVLCQSCNTSKYMDRAGKCQPCEDRTIGERAPGIVLVLVVIVYFGRIATSTGDSQSTEAQDIAEHESVIDTTTGQSVATLDLLLRCAFQPTRIVITFVPHAHGF